MLWHALERLVGTLGASPFAVWLGTSTKRVECLFVAHLFGLILLLGSVVLMSLRLLGWCMTHKSRRELGQSLLPLTYSGLVLMILSGSMIFMGGAVSYFAGMWFRYKMIILVAAVLYHFVVFRRVVLAAGDVPRGLQAVVGIAALCLWFGVGWAGRSIAFF